jgi:hypothetical protein
LPIWGDMVPESLRDCRANTLTLWCLRPQETPCHWQKWIVLFHELMIPRGSSTILFLNWIKANKSVSLV